MSKSVALLLVLVLLVAPCIISVKQGLAKGIIKTKLGPVSYRCPGSAAEKGAQWFIWLGALGVDKCKWSRLRQNPLAPLRMRVWLGSALPPWSTHVEGCPQTPRFGEIWRRLSSLSLNCERQSVFCGWMLASRSSMIVNIEGFFRAYSLWNSKQN